LLKESWATTRKQMGLSTRCAQEPDIQANAKFSVSTNILSQDDVF